MLAEDKGKQMIADTMTLKDKLQLFEDYYIKLYKSSGVPEEDIKGFLDKVDLPFLTQGHRQFLDSNITC